MPRWIGWLLPLVIVHDIVSAFRPDLLGTDWYIVPTILSVLLAQVYRYWRVSNAVQRQQTKWVVFGGIAAGTVLLSLFAYFSSLSSSATTSVLGGLAGNTAWLLGETIIPLGVGMAILRSHLWDIDVLIRRTLVYAVLTALLALAYFGIVLVLEGLVRQLTGQSQSQVVTVVSTLAIAALFVPVRRRVQAFIDRRFYRRKYDAARTLAAFSNTVRDEVELGRLTDRLTDVVDETLQPESVSLWLRATGAKGRTE